MKKYLLLISICLVILTSCTTILSNKKVNIVDASAFAKYSFNKLISAVFDRYASYGGTVFMGISGPYTDKKKAIEVATTNCLKMASLYEQLTVTSDITMAMDSKYPYESFKEKASATYDETSSNIEILDVVWYGGEIGAVVFASAKELEPTYLNNNTSLKINSYEEIPGFYSSVGETSEYYYIQDSIEAAAFYAASNILMQHQNTVTSVDEYIETKLNSVKSSSEQLNYNNLKAFKVLKYEYDELTHKYYALAISK